MKTSPWYKQFWPWFLILLPASAVIASVYTFYVAANSPFAIVSDDYYKQGKAINQDLSRIRAAKNLGLSFALEIDDREIRLVQHGGEDIGMAIKLSFQHATLAGKDFTQMLTQDGQGVYRLALDEPLQGNWRVHIDAYNDAWRLQNRLELPATKPLWFN